MGNQQTESQQSPYRPNYIWVPIFFGLLLVVLASGLDRLLGVTVFLLVVSGLIFTAVKPEYKIKGCVGLVVLGILLAIATPNITRTTIKMKNAEVKQNLHAIQLGLEEYATDFGFYPPSIQALLDDKDVYLGELPRNPFKSYKPTQSEIPWILDGNWMVPLNETGWPGNWDEHAGDFFYFPIKQQVNGDLVTTGYDLLALGAKIQNWNRETAFHKKSTVPILHLGGRLQAVDQHQP